MHFPPLPSDDLEHVLAHTRGHWEALRGKRLFVTGATGFFGIWLLETFAHANHHLNLGAELVGLTRDPTAFLRKVPHIAQHRAISLCQGDVRTFAFPEGPFSHVIHAGTTSGKPVPPLEMLDTIIQGTRRTLDFAVAKGAPDFLLVSSGAVYGKQPPHMTHIPETYTGGPDVSDPNSAYGEGKRVAELLGSIYRQEHGLNLKIARCFAFVGPHLPLDAHFAIGNFIRDALGGGPITVKDGSPYRSYLYAADLATWLWTILFHGESRAYNVGSDKHLTVATLAQTVGATLSADTTIKHVEGSSHPSLCSRYVPDVRHIFGKPFLHESVTLVEAIRKTAAWHQRNASLS